MPRAEALWQMYISFTCLLLVPAKGTCKTICFSVHIKFSYRVVYRMLAVIATSAFLYRPSDVKRGQNLEAKAEAKILASRT